MQAGNLWKQQFVEEEEVKEEYRMEETALPNKDAKLVNSAGIQILFNCRSSGRSWIAVIPSSQDKRSNGLESLRRLESQYWTESFVTCCAALTDIGTL